MCVYCVAPEMLVFGGPLLQGTVQTFSEGMEWMVRCLLPIEPPFVPVPKKGDLTMCDNWRSISLLEFAVKLLGRIM